VRPAPYTVALVPAKLTSQRIAKKNIESIISQPLFLFSVLAGLKTEGVDETFVSSESSLILDQARQTGAGVIVRPDVLSEPSVKNIEVIKHALDEIEKMRGRRPDYLVLLQPTHPFRYPPDISSALVEIRKDQTIDSLVSLSAEKRLVGNLEGDIFYPQDTGLESSKGRFVNCGSFYILRVANTIAKNQLLGQRIRGFLLSKPSIEIDIDIPEDLAMARGLAELIWDDLIHFGLVDEDLL